MGKSLDWLSADGCLTVAGQILRDPEERGGEVWAWCPWHEESSKGGFSYSPAKDIGHCYGCNTHGDLIAIYAAVNGLDASAAFKEFRDRFAPHVRPDRRPAVQTPRMPQAITGPTVAARPVTLPPEQWMDRAARVVDAAHAALLANPEQLDWLAARGITRQTVIRHRLGWQDRDYLRPYPAWGLPAATWDDGRERLHKVPSGLVIPMIEAGRVVRMRVRQPEKDPKYYVVIGGATDPQPLLVLDSTWPGQHSAVVLVEAELDALLLAQEAGDIVTVVALGSAQTRPHDTRAHRTVTGAAWVGLWVDRDAAGDQAVRAWTVSTRKPDQPADGGLAVALGVDAEDIRPQGAGKMDPGDCHKAGLDIRAHILSSVPAAWRIGPSVTGSVQGGGGAAPMESAESAGPGPGVVRLAALMRVAPLVCRYGDDSMWIMAARKTPDGAWVRMDDGRLVQDAAWEMSNWQLMREASRLFWHDAGVGEYLETHPDARAGISGRNFWAGMKRK